jgi:hypothetical protein
MVEAIEGLLNIGQAIGNVFDLVSALDRIGTTLGGGRHGSTITEIPALPIPEIRTPRG